MVRQTSIDVYHDTVEQRGTQAQVIYDFLNENNRGMPDYHNFTLKEISRFIGIEINAVSGRVNELKKQGLITECPKRPCSITKRLVTPVKIWGFHGTTTTT